jgi:hypothetical protein
MYKEISIKKNQFIYRSLVIFLILIFIEGILRKWIFNNITYEIILSRDLLLIFCILYGFKNKLYKTNLIPEKFLLLSTLIIVFWSAIQLLFIHNNIIIFLIGLRNWIIFYWFVLLFYRTSNVEDFLKILKLLYYSSIPIIILACFQFYSPLESFINKQNLSNDGFIFQVVPGVVRPSSIFTFSYNYTQFLTLISSIFFGAILSNKFNDFFTKKKSYLILIILLLSAITSGSRGYIVYFLFILSCFILLNFFSNNNISKKINIIPLIIIVLTVIFLSQDSLEIISSRFKSAASQESFIERIISMAIGTNIGWDNLKILGEGLGIASNLAIPFIEQENFYLGEFDSDRILNEAGVIGLFFIFLKIIFLIILLLKTINLKYYNYDNFRICLFLYMFIFHQILFSSITGQVAAQSFFILGLSFYFVLLKKDNN